jgi:hypothetical protein
VGTADGALEQVGHLGEKVVYVLMKHILNLTAFVAHKVDVGGGVPIEPLFAAYGEANNRAVGRQVVQIAVDRS